MDIKNQINWRQGKYILPAILYFPLLGLGYLFIDLFQVELSEEKPTDMQTTEYLNSDLPSANVRADIGGKRENVEKAFGDIRDFSGVDNIDDDRDSLMKKEGFDSRYTEKDLALLDSLSQCVSVLTSRRVPPVTVVTRAVTSFCPMVAPLPLAA